MLSTSSTISSSVQLKRSCFHRFLRSAAAPSVMDTLVSVTFSLSASRHLLMAERSFDTLFSMAVFVEPLTPFLTLMLTCPVAVVLSVARNAISSKAFFFIYRLFMC